MSPLEPPVTPDDDDAMGTDDVAKKIGVSVSTVLELIKKGEMPAFRVGRQYRIWKSDYQAWLARQRTNPSATIAQQQI